MANVEHAAAVPTGIPGLDAILNGGLTPNRIYLVEGDPGSGKTTMALQFLMEGRQRGESGLYICLSETKEELEGVATSHGWSLDGIHTYELLPSGGMLDADEQSRLFHPSEVELHDTTRAILTEVERTRPVRVVLDSLSEMRLLAELPLRYRRQVLAIKQFFIGRQCTVLLLDDRTAGDHDLQLHSLAHGVITLEHFAQAYGSERRRVRVVKMRGRAFRGGYHDCVIRTGGLQVFPRLVAAEHRRPFPQDAARSGVPQLDTLVGGGLDRGTSALLIGPAGSGKSTIAMQFVAAAAERGERSIVYTFDETIGTMIARAEGLGIDLRSHIDSGIVRVQQVDPGELSPGEFVHSIRSAVEADNARLVVIDSLNGYMNAMPEERFLTIQLHEILTYLAQQGIVTIMVVAQQGLLGAGMETPVDASYLADTVLALRYFEATGELRRAISAVKKRSGAHEVALREMRIEEGGLSLGEPLTGFHGVMTGMPLILGAEGNALPSVDDGASRR